tara:strand:- start:591 stop:899 length:309 start_codon:yes stop_codon:yes gene_type:complete
MKKIFAVISILISLNVQLQAKEYKSFLCNHFVSYTLAGDNCQGTNSWYKIYFPDNYKTKEICYSQSEQIFNNSLIINIFPDYQNSGDEIKSWISGCDNLWMY